MEDLKKLAEELLNIDAREGLPEEIFLAVSTLTPIANVDLLIRDDQGRVLLSWRDDDFFGRGWHLPGGCIRFKETMEERIEKTALRELGTKVLYEKEPLAVRDAILEKEKEFPKLRAHHLAVLYNCRLPDNVKVQNGERREHDMGFLKWFSKIPDDLLPIHNCYEDVFRKMKLLKCEGENGKDEN